MHNSDLATKLAAPFTPKSQHRGGCMRSSALLEVRIGSYSSDEVCYGIQERFLSGQERRPKQLFDHGHGLLCQWVEIGRASCRERVF